MCYSVVPILFGWFLRVPSLHALVFIRKLFCDLFLFFFFYCFLEIVREKRGGRGGQGEDAWSVKYESIELWCSQQAVITNSNAKAKPHETQVVQSK